MTLNWFLTWADVSLVDMHTERTQISHNSHVLFREFHFPLNKTLFRQHPVKADQTARFLVFDSCTYLKVLLHEWLSVGCFCPMERHGNSLYKFPFIKVTNAGISWSTLHSWIYSSMNIRIKHIKESSNKHMLWENLRLRLRRGVLKKKNSTNMTSILSRCNLLFFVCLFFHIIQIAYIFIFRTFGYCISSFLHSLALIQRICNFFSKNT